MSNQPLLLEVPRDHPPRPSDKSQLKVFKQKHGIWTHNCPGESTRAFPKWMAMLLPFDGDGKERYSDHRSYCKSDDPFEIIAGYCRIMEESERCMWGHTEKDAVKNLCEANSIPFELPNDYRTPNQHQ